MDTEECGNVLKQDCCTGLVRKLSLFLVDETIAVSQCFSITAIHNISQHRIPAPMEIHLKLECWNMSSPTYATTNTLNFISSVLASQNIWSHSCLCGHYCKDSAGCRQPERKKKTPKVSG